MFRRWSEVTDLAHVRLSILCIQCNYDPEKPYILRVSFNDGAKESLSDVRYIEPRWNYSSFSIKWCPLNLSPPWLIRKMACHFLLGSKCLPLAALRDTLVPKPTNKDGKWLLRDTHKLYWSLIRVALKGQFNFISA